MAVDKLVDSTSLDNTLTGIANAIRAKGGTSEQIPLDGMAQEIANIPSGSTVKMYGLSHAFHGASKIEGIDENGELTIHLADASENYEYNQNIPFFAKIDYAFSYAKMPVKKIVLSGHTIICSAILAFGAEYGGNVTHLQAEIISMPNFDFSKMIECYRMFSNAPNLRVIDANLSLIHISAYEAGYNFRGMFDDSPNIESVRFVKNGIPFMNTSYQIFKNLSKLDNASLVSIANGLAVGSDTPNISFHATPFARIPGIIGNVSDGLFIADEGGDMSLADFITTVKGWTLYSA